MDDFYFKKSRVPAFGSWDYTDNDPPFTQCFESARQDGLLRYGHCRDRDLYVAGDLYDNAVVTPAMIVVPRQRGKERKPCVKEGKKEEGWVGCGCECEYEYDEVKVKEAAASPVPPSPPPRRRAPKAVDEDLYRISPHLLLPKPRKKRAWGFFFSSCVLPTCVH